jgi:hypothetical protein
VERTVGSMGRYGKFDRAFLAVRASVAAKWNGIDRVSNRGEELPPVSLYIYRRLLRRRGSQPQRERHPLPGYGDDGRRKSWNSTPGYPRPSPRTPALKTVSCLWWKGPQRRRRGGDARPILPDATPRRREGEKSGARRGLGDAGPQRSDDVTLCGASRLKCV